MVLNWTPEIIVEIFVSLILYCAAYITYHDPKTKKIRSLVYIRLGLIFMALLFFLDLTANLLLSEFLTRITGLTLIPAAIFFVVGINYIIKETYNSIFLIVVCSAGILLFYTAFQPGTVGFSNVMGFLNINWIGIYELMGSLFIIFMGSISFYWGFKTWLNAPFLIKKEASIFLLGVSINGPLTLTLYSFSFWSPIFILFAYISIGIGTLTFCIIMVKEPTLLYILPFTLYRIIVKDREGYLLFEHDWSSSNVHESVFTGFLNAVQLMSGEIMKMGGLLDIQLENGILIMHESETVTIGLVSSKSSKLLRGLVVSFSNAFQKRFQKELKESCRDLDKYYPTYELLDHYFSNFPYKLVKNKKQPLFLATKSSKISDILNEELQAIFQNDKENSFILKELQKAPHGFIPEFLKLHDELKEETELILENKIKLLNTKEEDID